MKYWYVYQMVFSDGTFYIGYRGSTDIKSDFLIKYTSSSKNVLSKIESGIRFTGTILSIFENQIEAYDFEQQLIYDNRFSSFILNEAFYKNRKGWGILNNESKKRISNQSKSMWSNNEFKHKMSKIHKNRWTDELKDKQSKRLKGVKRPEHASSMIKYWDSNDAEKHHFRNLIRTDNHCMNISKSLKNKPKSEKHKANMSLAAKNRKLKSCSCGKSYLPAHARYHVNCAS